MNVDGVTFVYVCRCVYYVRHLWMYVCICECMCMIGGLCAFPVSVSVYGVYVSVGGSMCVCQCVWEYVCVIECVSSLYVCEYMTV